MNADGTNELTELKRQRTDLILKAFPNNLDGMSMDEQRRIMADAEQSEEVQAIDQQIRDLQVERVFAAVERGEEDLDRITQRLSDQVARGQSTDAFLKALNRRASRRTKKDS